MDCEGVRRADRSVFVVTETGDHEICTLSLHDALPISDKRVTGAGTHTAICRHTPEVGAVCGKAARTVLCGGRAMKRTSLPLHRRKFTALLAAGSLARTTLAQAQEAQRVPLIGFLHPGFPDSGSVVLD